MTGANEVVGMAFAAMQLFALAGALPPDPTDNAEQREVRDFVNRNMATMSRMEFGAAFVVRKPRALACGGRFDPDALAVAHKSFPCGTVVTIFDLRRGTEVKATVTDRLRDAGGDWLLDVTPAVARKLGADTSIIDVKLTWEPPKVVEEKRERKRKKRRRRR